MTNEELSNVAVQLGNEIKERRVELKLSQLAIADKTGLGVATVKRIESGVYWPNLKQYIILRAALGLSVEFKGMMHILNLRNPRKN
jgi:transcriptional regulator with XRE-family HTH domain